MTTDDKLRMLLHPERHTVSELDRMLSDEDISVPDAGHEWQRFMAARTPKHPARTRLRLAAACAALLLMSGLSAAGVLWLAGYQPHDARPESAPAPEATATVSDTPHTPRRQGEARQVPFTFENQELQVILTQLAAHYGVAVNYRNDSVRHVRLYLQWDDTQTLHDVIDKINHFEKVHLTLDEQTINAE